MSSGSEPHWKVGKNNRSRGSIHSDIWEGSAFELAKMGVLAVYPTSGWWKTRKKHGRYNNKTRYSLIVSIVTKKTDIDIYTPVASMLEIPTVV